MIFGEHVLFEIGICQQVLVDSDGNLGLLQILLLETCFLEKLDKLFWAIFDRECLSDGIPAVLLLAYGVCWSCKTIAGDSVLFLLFLEDFARFTTKAEFVDQSLKIMGIM